MTEQNAPLYQRLEALAQEFARKAWEDPKAPNSAFLQDHAYTLNEFAQQAEGEHLSDGEVVSAAQQRRIGRLLANGRVSELTLGYKPFDLPEGWIMVRATYSNGQAITGGISPQGDMST